MLIIGIDEVGYGAIAGPLVVGATAYLDNYPQPHTTVRGKKTLVRDSKSVRKDHLTALTELVCNTAVTYEFILLSQEEIDKMGGPSEAKTAGLERAVCRIMEKLRISGTPICETRIVVDGYADLNVPYPYEAVPKADKLIWQVGAASILAKNEQVQCMESAHRRFPIYGFNKHYGYPTKAHKRALEEHGPCLFHRRSTVTLKPWTRPLKGRE